MPVHRKLPKHAREARPDARKGVAECCEEALATFGHALSHCFWARRPFICPILAGIYVVIVAFSNGLQAEETPHPTSQQLEFFESRIRPVLVDQCYACHNSSSKKEGGLSVDHRAAIIKGGDSGPAVVPGAPKDSLLIQVLRHEVDGQEMPQSAPPLAANVIADFEKWVSMGLPDPRDKAPTAEEMARSTAWPAILEKRKQWWSFRPIEHPEPPTSVQPGWSNQPIDCFILDRLTRNGLQPEARADAATLVRRLHFALIGLPPTPEAASLWTRKLDEAPTEEWATVYAELVDSLLSSPHFGEHWARHWMDWIRYAESHGSEGDPLLAGAWQYRDYLIRGLNADVPYDQLVREHVAGDLLETPRLNEALGINESLIGPAHWRMVFHGFAPTDALDEKVRFIDDEINVFSKAFLGLTVSCARCHNHKFDAISQTDYYALFGILGSCRPGRAVVDLPERQMMHMADLEKLKPQIQEAIANTWLKEAPHIVDGWLGPEGKWKTANPPGSILALWQQLQPEGDQKDFSSKWKKAIGAWQADIRQREAFAQGKHWQDWNFNSQADYDQWEAHGVGLPRNPLPAGTFAVAPAGENVLTGIYPGGIYTHRLSAKHPARLTSGDLQLDDDYELRLLVIGDGKSMARYVVQDYPRDGTVYPVPKLKPGWQWLKLDLKYWKSDQIHIELTTAQDAPLLVANEPRSWFGIREAVITRTGEPVPPSTSQAELDPIFASGLASPPDSLEDLAKCYRQVLIDAIENWKANRATDAQALLLGACLEQGLLPNHLNELPTAAVLVQEYRRLEEEIPVPTRVPGLDDGIGTDQPLLVRGDHKQPGDLVPRRFLEAVDATPLTDLNSGRRQLAEDLLRMDNPFTRRVIVNRLWQHLFDRGIVSTPDNFGRMGAEPTHPELLDWLANRLVEQQWSLKSMIREMVTSRTWQLTSRPSELALAKDPDNQFLSHAHLRRLEAEAIRDELLSVSGRLDLQLFGPAVGGQASRRSIYLQVRRNDLDPFLRLFDFPEPFSATGRRDVTNVPAQSLTLMNDPELIQDASAWATRVLIETPAGSPETRINRMFFTAFSRPPSTEETRGIEAYLQLSKQRRLKLVEERTFIVQNIDEQMRQLQDLLVAARSREKASQGIQAASPGKLARPIHRWDFADSIQDGVGGLQTLPQGNVPLQGNAAVVGQQGYITTAPLKQSLTEKTLEAWVQLDTLNQRGGGVMTVQTRDGQVFDSIVFAEQAPGQWLAGSDFFHRTRSFEGMQETMATSQPVQIAIVYHADGRITAYRNGLSYGNSYQSTGPAQFPAGDTVILLGLRHSPTNPSKSLNGRIFRARLYDRALSSEEVLASFNAVPRTLTDQELISLLTPEQREQAERLRTSLQELNSRLNQLGTASTEPDEKLDLTELARALFLFKEFIYVR